MTDWAAYDQMQRIAARVRNTLVGVSLNQPDDSGSVQHFQTTGHVGEIRNKTPHIGHHGISSLPVTGAQGVALYLNGDRRNGFIVGTIDSRYRPTGLKPGESQLYMIDGADKSGNHGTTRLILNGLLGWITRLFGMTIFVGDSHTQKITLIASNQIMLNADVVISGNLTVKGQTTTVQDLNIQGNETGGGTT